MSDDLDLAIAGLGDLDDLSELAGAAVDLDLLVEELLEGRDVEDLIARGLGGVDDKLLCCGIRRRLAICFVVFSREVDRFFPAEHPQTIYTEMFCIG